MPGTVTFLAAVMLTLWCAARALMVDALAGPLERVEFEGASQPGTRSAVIPGDPIQGAPSSSPASRHRSGRGAEEGDELAASDHSITSSARPSSVIGKVRPSA